MLFHRNHLNEQHPQSADLSTVSVEAAATCQAATKP